MLTSLTDEQLIEKARREPGASERACLEALYGRYYAKVAAWCLSLCGDPDLAADLAQEVFVRVHERLNSFRLESRFSTWLYTVTRRVVINHSTSRRRRQSRLQPVSEHLEPIDERPHPEALTERNEIVRRLRRSVAVDLEPLEAQALYLHIVDGLTLPTITDLLALTNKSGAKALIVSARRKLSRRFGRWLAAQSPS